MHVGTHGTIRTYQYCTYHIPLHDRRTVCERFKQLLLVGLLYKNTYVSYVCTETFQEEDPSLAIKYIISMRTNIFNIIAKPGSSASTATPTAVFQIVCPPERDASVERDVSLVERGKRKIQHPGGGAGRGFEKRRWRCYRCGRSRFSNNIEYIGGDRYNIFNC